MRVAPQPRRLLVSPRATLFPGIWQIAHVHPYGTSAYGELAGDIPGAATLGMQRQYWSNNVTGVLPWLNAHCPPGRARLLPRGQRRELPHVRGMGMLREDIRYAPWPEQADYAALQWHREFRDREPETWNAFGTRRPATVSTSTKSRRSSSTPAPACPARPKGRVRTPYTFFFLRRRIARKI